MDAAALRAAILARDDCAALVTAKDCQAIAEIISVGRTRFAPRFIGVGSVMSALGAIAGATVLKRIQGQVASNPVVEFAWMLLDRGALDVGDAETHAQFDLLAAGGLMTAAEAEKLKALGRVPDPYTPADIAAALFFDNGELR